MDKKNLEKIYKMTQKELKSYAVAYLRSMFDNIVAEDGFVYAKGTVPVLLVAHLDTVHKEPVTKIIYSENGNKISSPQGIGGDDRNGVAIIFELVKKLHCSVLLCEDEEKGGIGAHKFVNATYDVDDRKEKYVEHLDVNYMIEFDRKGNSDAVFYSCDNKDFIDFVEDTTGFKCAFGTYSDISTLMPASKLSGVNLSSGYYSPHNVNEYVMYDDMIDTIDAAEVLIKEKCDGPFVYVAKKYTPPKYSYPRYNYPQYNYGYMGGHYGYGDGYSYHGSVFNEPERDKEDLAVVAINDTDMELEVIITGLDMSEETITVTGETKAECWMKLFLENPSLCFNDIVDYSWG